ncbi:bestrophin family protein [Algoriphagus terrigena]|uniref:bestrophin family protein n=1 Tax=Algoriphagus terrigena TaxID=344884 RepID=UPI00047A0756|nr:bestrophin family ion channel [Algoriphagus terrigena]
MKVYDNKDWLQFLFLVTKSDTLNKLAPLILLLIAYSVGIVYLEINYLEVSADSWIRNLPQMHSLLSFVISMLLVFRTNTAYDRWWEGRKLWGQLVNNSRNLAIKIAGMTDPSEEEVRTFFRRAIPIYAFCLKDHLQSKQTEYSLHDGEIEGLPAKVDAEKHVPNQVAKGLFAKINLLYKGGKITGDQLIVLNGEISALTDICGACERIKNTPIPYSYSSFIKKFIMLYTLSLPIGYAYLLGYFAAPIVAFVFYVLASLELIAEEIEEPFGSDENDLPMGKMSENIQRHVGEILG